MRKFPTTVCFATLALIALVGCKTLDAAVQSIGTVATGGRAAPGSPTGDASDANAPDSLSDRIPNPQEMPPPRDPPIGHSALTNGCYQRAQYGIGIPGDTYFSDYLFGATPQQVVQLLGPPAQQHYGTTSRLTLGAQRLLESFRLEMLYPGRGRLIFGVSPLANRQCSGLRVQYIIHNPKEPARMKRENAHLYSYSGSPPPGAIPSLFPGMNEAGEVVDTWKVELGYGKSLREKSTNPNRPGPFAGEVFGKPAADSLFAAVQVGMPCGTALKTTEQEPDGVFVAPPGLRRMLDGQQAEYYALVFVGAGVLIAREPRFPGPNDIVAVVNNKKQELPAASSTMLKAGLPAGCVHRYKIIG